MLAAAELHSRGQGPRSPVCGKPEVPKERRPCCQQGSRRREVWSVVEGWMTQKVLLEVK